MGISSQYFVNLFASFNFVVKRFFQYRFRAKHQWDVFSESIERIERNAECIFEIPSDFLSGIASLLKNVDRMLRSLSEIDLIGRI